MDRDTWRMMKTCFAYLLTGVICAVFGAVYEHFSHGVYSFWMAYACLFPLVLGAIPFGMAFMQGKSCPTPWALRLWHSGVVTWTVGSIIEGVLEIYGTTNHLTIVYWVAGGALLLLSRMVRKKKNLE